MNYAKVQKVPFVNYPKAYDNIMPEVLSEVDRVLSEGDLILREDVEIFEQNLAELVGTKYAVGLNSGTDALFLSLKLAGVGPGDEVITVGHTFHATVEAIHWNGATAVLVDVGEDSLMDMDAVKKAITKKTKAIIPVQLMGDVCDMEKLRTFWNGIVIEDACQALGAIYKPKSLTQCWSFFPAKILGSYGDAGAITTDDEALAKEMKDMRQHYKYNPGKYGFNSRMDNIQAAILNVKLGFLQDAVTRRKRVATMYDWGLKDLDIKLPKRRWIYQDYIIRTKERDSLASFLKNRRVETMLNEYHFPNDLPKPKATIQLEKETLRIPCNETLEDDDVEYVISQIRKFYGGGK